MQTILNAEIIINSFKKRRMIFCDEQMRQPHLLKIKWTVQRPVYKIRRSQHS